MTKLLTKDSSETEIILNLTITTIKYKNSVIEETGMDDVMDWVVRCSTVNDHIRQRIKTWKKIEK